MASLNWEMRSWEIALVKDSAKNVEDRLKRGNMYGRDVDAGWKGGDTGRM